MKFNSAIAENHMTAQMGWFVQGTRLNAILVFIDKEDEPDAQGMFSFKERASRPASPQEFDMWEAIVKQAAELWRRSGVQDNGGGFGMKAENARDSLGTPKEGNSGARP